MARHLPVAGGDARLGGGLELGAVARGEKHTARGDHGRFVPKGETVMRGGGKGLGSGGVEKPDAPKAGAKGESIARGGGRGLGTPGTEKPGDADGGPRDATHYADPGYQADGKHRLPVHTEKHARASLRVFNKIKGNYNARDAHKIGLTISRAAKAHGIDPYENAMRK